MATPVFLLTVNGDTRRSGQHSSSSSGDGQELEEERNIIRKLLSSTQLPKVGLTNSPSNSSPAHNFQRWASQNSPSNCSPAHNFQRWASQNSPSNSSPAHNFQRWASQNSPSNSSPAHNFQRWAPQIYGVCRPTPHAPVSALGGGLSPYPSRPCFRSLGSVSLPLIPLFQISGVCRPTPHVPVSDLWGLSPYPSRPCFRSLSWSAVAPSSSCRPLNVTSTSLTSTLRSSSTSCSCRRRDVMASTSTSTGNYSTLPHFFLFFSFSPIFSLYFDLFLLHFFHFFQIYSLPINYLIFFLYNTLICD